MADGESGEPLGARFAKMQGSLPNLIAVARCQTHTASRELEKAISSDSRAQHLIETLVNKFSSGDANPGGLARALRNSVRLRTKLDAKAKQLSAIDDHVDRLKATMMPGFAAQRFDTIAETACGIVNEYPVVLAFLAEVVAEQGKSSLWAANLLTTAFSAENLLLWSLLAEFLASARKFVHSQDNSKSSPSNLARTAFHVQILKTDLNKLFYFRDLDGKPQEPLVFNPHFTQGFVQKLLRKFDLLKDAALVINKALVLFREGAVSEDRLKAWAAAELGTVLQNICEVFLQAIGAYHDNSLAAAYAPFDVEYWQNRSDVSLFYTWYLLNKLAFPLHSPTDLNASQTDLENSPVHLFLVYLRPDVFQPIAEVLKLDVVLSAFYNA